MNRYSIIFIFMMTTAFAYGMDAPFENAMPQIAGMNAALLEQARDYALKGGGSGCILRGGKLVFQWGDQKQRYDLFSTTKSIGVTALGLAMMDGKVQLHGRAQSYLPDVGMPPDSNADTGWLDDLTLWHLATHTGGFEKTRGWCRQLFAPGTAWIYSDGGTNWLADCLTMVYGRDLRDVMMERVFQPLGITVGEDRTSGDYDLYWGFNNLDRPDQLRGINRRPFGAGIWANVEAMAKIGYLYLRRGRWESQQIIPADFIDLVRTTPPGLASIPVHTGEEGSRIGASRHYGLLWWNNADGAIDGVPEDAYWSSGLKDSWIFVIPSLDMVAVRAGDYLAPRYDPIRENSYENIVKPFLWPICQSVGLGSLPNTGENQQGNVSLYMKPESAVLSGDMTFSSKLSTVVQCAISGKGIFCNADEDNADNHTRKDAAEYRINLPVDAAWYLWARMYAIRNWNPRVDGPSAFWMSVDDGDAKLLGAGQDTFNVWQWNGIDGKGLSLGVLEAGLHTLRIWNHKAQESDNLSPRLDVLMLSNNPSAQPDDLDALLQYGRPFDPPYPRSVSITDITIEDRILDKDINGDAYTHGDQWAGTWADDDHMYMGWGDGCGFGYRGKSFRGERWNTYMGLARVEGTPPDHRGFNVWSGYEPESQAGALYVDKKPEPLNLKPGDGLIFLNGVMYWYAERKSDNRIHSQLLTSTDYGKNWMDHGRFFQEDGKFAYTGVIQFGRNYADFPDNLGQYLYMFDGGTKNEDHPHFTRTGMLMARIPLNDLLNRQAVEFFNGTPDSPAWTPDIAKAKSVFVDRNGINSEVSCIYNKALGRYILLTMHKVVGEKEGFGIFESERPWGPWSTVYYTNNLDTFVPGLTLLINVSAPSKWVSRDGKTLWLVFSGRPSDPMYSFNLVKIRLTPGAP